MPAWCGQIHISVAVFILAVLLLANCQDIATDIGPVPRNLQAQTLNSSNSSLLIQWDAPEVAKWTINGYKIFYTTDPSQTPMTDWQSQMLGNSLLTTLNKLIPHTVYTIRIQSFSDFAPGPLSASVQVKTQQDVPSPPLNLVPKQVGITSVTLQWKPPTQAHDGDNIISYQLYWNDTYAKELHTRQIGKAERYILGGLYPSTLYYIWLAAHSQKGEGTTTLPIAVRTRTYGIVPENSCLIEKACQNNKVIRLVPGEPQDVKVVAVDTTSLQVTWKPPLDKDQNGTINGYHVYVQELRDQGFLIMNDTIRRDVINESTLQLIIPDLQPDRRYNVQVTAFTRRGDGDRSIPVTVKTTGGVPNRPILNIKILERDSIVIELNWVKPTHTYGPLQGYRLKYGIEGQPLEEHNFTGINNNSYKITNLNQGVMYEFRLAGRNQKGVGQELIKYWFSPEGPPKGPPTNMTFTFQTADIIKVAWEPPIKNDRNGHITKYNIQFYKNGNQSSTTVLNTTTVTRAVFTGLEEDAQYVFRVRAYTDQGAGPYSKEVAAHTYQNMVRAPMSVKALAAPESAAQVLWEPVPSNGDITGYVIFYSINASEDLDEWIQKSVPVTHSADLNKLINSAEYTVAVAAKTKKGLGILSEKVTVRIRRNEDFVFVRALRVFSNSMELIYSWPLQFKPELYKISYNVDSQEMMEPKEVTVNYTTRNITIRDLLPFTTYNVNVTALPKGEIYMPPSKITVTTPRDNSSMVDPVFYRSAY